MENLIPIPQGGAQKRPGTKYVAEVKTSSLATRILPFEFSTSQSYIIEVGNQYMRFYTSGAPVFTTFGTEDLSGIGSIVAHWLCDDNAANTTVLDDDGNTHDATASSNTSTISVVDAEGVANEAFDLNGSDYFTIADHDDFSFNNGTDGLNDATVDLPFSIAFWAYFETASEDAVLIQKGGSSDSEYTVNVTSGTLQLVLVDENAGGDPSHKVTTTDVIVAGWHFVVVTYSGVWGITATVNDPGSEIGIKIYLDWREVKANITGVGAGYVAMQNDQEELAIGAGAVAHGSIWDGKIDNVAIFSKELTAVEITSLTGNDSTTPVEIVTPYLTANLFELKFEQSADVLYITHPDYETKKLSRLGNSLWSMNAIGIETGPFRTQNDDVIKTIAASATTGSVTLTATGHAPFISGATAGHLPSGSVATSKSQTGALFRLVHPLDTLEYTAQLTADIVAGQVEGTNLVSCGVLYKGAGWTFTTGETWFGTVKVQRNYTIGAGAGDGGDEGASAGWETVLSYNSGSGASSSARNVTTSGTEEDAPALYRVIYADEVGDDTVGIYFTTDQTEHIGIVKITAVASTTSATATVLTTLASTDATHKWSEGAWSNYRGWPQTVTFFEDRLCFGGNTAQPDTIWASVTSDYQNMTAGPDDDEALVFTLSSRQVNVIEWIIGKDKLLIGTSGAEWTIAGGTDEPLTPSNAIAKQHSTYGSANLQATLANESVLFFQRGAAKMRELAYNWELDSYVAPDMTILANLVTLGGIVDISFQKTPDSILWCVRTDGELPIFSYERAENITAWSRMVT
ncbi:MAG TPA: hypothetical protein ENI05_08290, partial [Porticoccus sp.]|nr:hypothetical protein [Porticoccus sp.]